MATSVPVPMAMPRSAWASAGASLMPSPTIATTLPCGLELADLADFLLGQHLGEHVVDADLAGDRLGGGARCRRSASRRPARAPSAARPPRATPACSVSATAISPAGWPSMATYIGVAPCCASASACSLQAVERDRRPRPAAPGCRAARRGRRPAPGCPGRSAPGSARRWSAARAQARGRGRRSPRRAGARSRPPPPRPAAAARARRRRRLATTRVTAGLPRVSVPVLSSTMVLMRRALSSASPPRIRMPCSAALPVPTMIAVGVARPSAHGQAMISTAIAACSA